MEQRSYTVDGMTCAHCVSAVRAEVGAVPGLSVLDVSLATKRVQVAGHDIDDAAVLAAVAEAGYEAVRGPSD